MLNLQYKLFLITFWEVWKSWTTNLQHLLTDVDATAYFWSQLIFDFNCIGNGVATLFFKEFFLSQYLLLHAANTRTTKGPMN